MDDSEEAKLRLRLLEIENEAEQAEEHINEKRATFAMCGCAIIVWFIVIPFMCWHRYYFVAFLVILLPFLVKYAVNNRVK